MWTASGTRVDAGAGNDTIRTGENQPVIYAGSGNDTLTVPTLGTASILDGGLGVDTVDFSTATSPFTANLSTGTLTGPPIVDGLLGRGSLIAVENVTGSSGADALTGSSGVIALRGCGGVDRLAGAGGIDNLFGGDDNDALNGGPGTDACDGGTGTDTATACERRTAIP